MAGVDDHLVAAEQIYNLFIRAVAERAKKSGCSDLSRSVNVHPLHVVGVLLVFKPCASVGDDGRCIARHAVLVENLVVVNARASDKLRDDNAFCTVDDERACVGHEREITHKHFLLHHFTGFGVGQTRFDFERNSIRCVAVFALFDGVFGFAVKSV